MSDLDRELRELLETKAQDGTVPPKPDPQVLKRARRRQLGTVVIALAGTAAVVVASIVGLQTLVRTSPDTPTPGDVPVPPDSPDGFGSVALRFASISYPDDWFLLETSPDHAPGAFEAFDVLQLTNWDPALRFVDCSVTGTRIPDHGVMLQVGLGNPDIDGSAWPVELREVADRPDADPCSATLHVAEWTAPSGIEYAAVAHAGREATPADLEALGRSFESLSFPSGSDPQTEDFSGTGSLILDSTDTPVGPVALYAYEEPCEGSTHWIGIAGPSGSGLAGSVGCGEDEVPTSDENVTMNLDVWGGVVWGEVAATVARAELRTVEGDTFPAELIPMPPSLGVEGTQVVWGIVEGPTNDRVTALLYDEQGNVLNSYFPSGPRITIAEGTDPEGGAWVLYLDVTSEGAGLGFRFETGGGGGGCCLKPFGGDFRLDGWGSGGDEPANITAIGSDVLDRVVFEAASGEVIEGQVFPIPDESLGVPKVALVLVPRDVPVEGDLVGYDADGNEIGREFVGDVGEPPGPTTEIDVVWTRLRRAREAVLEYAARHEGSLSGFDAAAAARIDPGIGGDPGIRWNDGPVHDGEVSIRGGAPAGGSEQTGWTGWTVVLVSATSGPGGSVGSTYCIAVNIDEDGGGNYRYGTQDAAGYTDCRGGWPELQS